MLSREYIRKREAFFSRLPLSSAAEKKAAKRQLQAIVLPIFEKYSRLMGVRPSKICFRPSKSRWGSCNYRLGHINLSYYLLLLPYICIEQVVVHELSHLLKHGHGRDFYAVHDKFFPARKQSEKLIKDIFLKGFKAVKVSAAVIVHDGRVLATQRSYGPHAGRWEFPGGKIEWGELPAEALARELSEEMPGEIKICSEYDVVEYTYPDFHISMNCFLCSCKPETIVFKEHSDARWLALDELDSVGWLPADTGVLEKIKPLLK